MFENVLHVECYAYGYNHHSNWHEVLLDSNSQIMLLRDAQEDGSQIRHDD